MIPTLTRPSGRPLLSAVTGTNGKTSVATYTRQLLGEVGWRVGAYDSLGVTDVAGRLRPSGVRRSPDYLPELIAGLTEEGAEAISLEAFVGILADGLFEHVAVDTAVCTGLERDHVDVHGSVEAYWDAKLRLFREVLRPDGIAVMATDCARGDLVEHAVRERGIPLVTVGTGGDLRLEDTRTEKAFTRGWLHGVGDPVEVLLPTTHDIAITNLLLSAAVVLAHGVDPVRLVGALSRVTPPPGRLELVLETGGVRVLVDTAHNPGALRTALHAVRRQTTGRVLLVVGAGGERDREKRPEMGEIAAGLADLVVITDDNPRREPPARIRADVRRGCPAGIEIPRREDAIVAALEMARPGDTLLVAGKGDETVQLIGTRRVPHDDREVIRSWGARTAPCDAPEGRRTG